MPERQKVGLVIGLLLNLVQQGLPLRAVTLPRLLREPLLDLGVLEERQGPGTEHRRFDPRRRVPGGAVAHPDQVFHRFLAHGGEHRRPFQRLHPGPNADGDQDWVLVLTSV